MIAMTANEPQSKLDSVRILGIVNSFIFIAFFANYRLVDWQSYKYFCIFVCATEILFRLTINLQYQQHLITNR